MARPPDTFAQPGVRSRFSEATHARLASGDPATIRVQRRVMGCRFEVVLAGDRRDQVGAARAALDAVDRIGALAAAGGETSELGRLNRTAHAASIRTSPGLFSLLELASDLTRDTEGAFDLTSAPLTRCWEVLYRERRLPSAQEIEIARASVGMNQVVLDGETKSVFFRRERIELNVASVGKGFALDRMAAQLRRAGVRRTLLSAGSGSVLASGGASTSWLMALWSSARGERLAQVHLRAGALATSRTPEPLVEVDGIRHARVVDPRTGWPASGTLSASVVTSRAVVADALSIAFLVGGVELARRYCDRHEGVLAIVTPDDQARRPVVVGAYPGARVEQL